MPELVEQMYCSQQIVIPPKFPYILKRFCKAAIKTQPYDLLRWSFEYFRALSERRPPPVKLRLEYPIYSTEGGLTRGCLKVLANQLAGQDKILLTTAKAAWQGFCLDPEELQRVFCLCEVFDREDSVLYLYFIAVAAGLLTKSLTHTMILLCETLTKEPDGGSAAIPVNAFLKMYKYLARMDASKDVCYINGYREGWTPPVEEPMEEEVEEEEFKSETTVEDDYWQCSSAVELRRVSLIDDRVANSSAISSKLNQRLIGEIKRSPSVERAANQDRDNYLMSRKGVPRADDMVDEKLKARSAQLIAISRGEMPKMEDVPKEKEAIEEEPAIRVTIIVQDEDENELPFEFYGEPPPKEEVEVEEDEWDVMDPLSIATDEKTDAGDEILQEKQKIQKYIAQCYQDRNERLVDLEETFEEIKVLVEKFQNANYDLGMVAGRQMSITSGEFIVNSIEKEIMEYINVQIAILPDPDSKKKKAKPEEIAMIRDILKNYLDENMDKIIPDEEIVQEEEEPIPEVVQVYAVPGIGPPVDEDTIRDFEDYALDVTKVQADLFMPRNIRHFMCPPLEKYQEQQYEDDVFKRKKNEVVTSGGGTIAD